jgi:hypothetical protein
MIDRLFPFEGIRGTSLGICAGMLRKIYAVTVSTASRILWNGRGQYAGARSNAKLTPTRRRENDRMSQFKFGMEAIEETNVTGGGAKNDSEFAKLPSGTTLKVKLTGLENVMRYFGYGVYKKVNTFIAKNPSERNAKGFVESGHTPWDLASQHYYDQAKKSEESGASEDEVKALRNEGFKYSGKARYAVGLIDIEVGKEIVLDFTKKQFMDVILPSLKKYDPKKDKVAFELSKTGARQDTKITLMPVLDQDEDLTDKERANFAKFVGKEFNKGNFEGLLFEADEKTQVENLVAAGFDISLIGYSIGGVEAQGNPQDVGEEKDLTEEF